MNELEVGELTKPKVIGIYLAAGKQSDGLLQSIKLSNAERGLDLRRLKRLFIRAS